MARSTTPLRAALVTFGAVIILGIAVLLVVTAANGTIHDAPFARGQEAGQGLGMFATLSAIAAYVIQKRRAGT